MPTAERERHAAEVVALVARRAGAVPAAVPVPRAVVPAGLTRPRQAAVLGWWDGQRATCPWRRTRDPWEVLVCEVMAQQTQVARVAERWRPFLDRFPTPAALARRRPPPRPCAGGPGLGYNRRALALHRAAEAVVARPRRPAARRPRRAARAAGHRALHGPGRAGLRLRGRPRRRRHQHGAGAGPVGGSTARAPRRCRRPPTPRSAGWPGVGVEPGDARPRRHGVHAPRRRAATACPVADGCAWAAAGRPDPDPADGSAGVSGGQSRFEGSDRQGRGRLVEALRARPGRRRRAGRGDGLARRRRPRAERVAATPRRRRPRRDATPTTACCRASAR